MGRMPHHAIARAQRIPCMAIPSEGTHNTTLCHASFKSRRSSAEESCCGSNFGPTVFRSWDLKAKFGVKKPLGCIDFSGEDRVSATEVVLGRLSSQPPSHNPEGIEGYTQLEPYFKDIRKYCWSDANGPQKALTGSNSPERALLASLPLFA